MKIIETLWFTGPQGCMGIVMGEGGDGEPRAIVGLATGSDPVLDSELIAQVGVKVTPAQAAALFRHFNPARVQRLEVSPGEEGDGGSFRSEG